MPPIRTRDDLKDYCLRRLGAPVIEINVADEQVEDRIDDALQFWNEYHFDGVEKVYLKEQITASTLKLTTADGTLFTPHEVLVGETSGSRAELIGLSDASTLMIRTLSGSFTGNETLIGGTSGTTAVLTATPFVQGNWDLGYLEISDAVTGVVNIFRPGTGGGSNGSSRNMFDIVYQYRLNDLYGLMSSDMIYYVQMKQHLDMLDMILQGDKTIRFNRKAGRLYIDADWNSTFIPGDYVIVEAYRILNPADFSKVYDDLFIKRMATALIKRQWAQNISKYQGIQLPGGVTLNAARMMMEANTEIDKLEDEMQSRFELPVDFFVG